MNPFATFGKNLLQESDRWILWTPVGVVVGIAIYFACPFEPSLYFLAATPFFAAACWFTRHQFALFVPLFALSMLGIGFNAGQIETRLSYTPMLQREQGPLPVTGRLMFTELMPDGVRLTLKDATVGRLPPEETPVKIRIKMKNKEMDDIPPPGAQIKLFAQVSPFSEPVMPGAHDFRRQGYFNQLGGLGWSYSRIEILDPSPPSASWLDEVELLFERARIALAQHVYARLSGDVGAMTASRLNGEMTAISKPVMDAMRIAGLVHILSTSGFNVTIMGLLVYIPLRAILALIPYIALRFPIKKWAATGAIFSAVGYTLLVGSPPATFRSMIMCAIAMAAIVIDRHSAPLRLVMLSAFLSMLIAPDAALGPSFQMSFAAVFCLIATHGHKLDWLIAPDHKMHMTGVLRTFADHMISIVTTSLIATAAVTPFAVYHFQTFSFYGFAANIMAIPLTSFLVQPALLMAYILAPFGLDGWCIDLAGFGTNLTIKIAETVAAWPYSIIYLPAMPWPVLVLATIGGLWFCIWRRRWRWWGLVPVAIACFYPLYTPQPDIMIAPDGKLWAARLEDGSLAVSNLRHDKFISTQWQQRLGNPPMLDIKEVPPDDTRLRCDDAGCIDTLNGNKIAFPELEAAALEDCEQSGTIIAAFAIKQCAAPHILDAPAFWFHGSHVIYRNGNDLSIEYTRPRRAMRPWSVGWNAKLRHEAALGDSIDD